MGQMITLMIIGIILTILGFVCAIMNEKGKEADGHLFALTIILFIIGFPLAMGTAVHTTLSYYEKYIPNIEELILQGKAEYYFQELIEVREKAMEEEG